MEEQVFPLDSVYPSLKDGFIEARLHLDGENRIGIEKLTKNRALRDEYSKSVAMPTFVVVDPKTRKTLGLMRGMRGVEAFLKFLSGSQAKAPGKTEKVGKSR